MNEQLSILVIDDDWATLQFFEKYLVGQGHKVCTLEDPLRAQAELREDRYDLVFLDLAMPGLSGLELLKQLRGAGNDVPVIITTGDSSIEAVTEAVECGISGYLIKPFSVHELAGAIERTTAGSGPV
jgi:two-component system OmpR family response regulator